MNSANIVLKYSIVLLTINCIMCDPCCLISSSKLPRYKLIKSTTRSNQGILSKTTVRNLNECTKFVLAKKALAFNYGVETDHYETIDITDKEWNIDGERNRSIETSKKMCEALQCPEIHNFTVLVRDKNYNYYSTYPSFLMTGANFTLACIPRTGIFAFSSNNLNYSQAQAACQKINASLAHIISEERTNGFAKYISQNTPTFVGLRNLNGNSIWKNEFGEPISCFNYRAWGKGEPSHSKGCVTLVQPSELKSGPFWKVVSCDSILPSICEISPMY